MRKGLKSMYDWLLVRKGAIIEVCENSFYCPFTENLQGGDLCVKNTTYPAVHVWITNLQAWKLVFSSVHSMKEYPEMPETFFLSALLLGLDTTQWNIRKSTQEAYGSELAIPKNL